MYNWCYGTSGAIVSLPLTLDSFTVINNLGEFIEHFSSAVPFLSLYLSVSFVLSTFYRPFYMHFASTNLINVDFFITLCFSLSFGVYVCIYEIFMNMCVFI